VTNVVLIRHGRTEWNRVERFRGRVDLDLDDIGMKQAELTAGRIKEWPISAIYTSPLKRTVTTAWILGRHLGIAVKHLPGIIDIDYGQWQGLSPEEAMVKDNTMYKMWLEKPHRVKFPAGESLREVRKRAARAVAEVVKRHINETIALVSHRVVCQILILNFLDLANSRFWQIGQDVAAVNLFRVSDEAIHTLLINDTCHLEGLSAI